MSGKSYLFCECCPYSDEGKPKNWDCEECIILNQKAKSKQKAERLILLDEEGKSLLQQFRDFQKSQPLTSQ